MLYFRAIAAASDLPIMLYNVPYRTGVNIESATVQELAQDAKFVAIKQCGNNMPQLMDLINDTPLKVLSGEDSLTLVTLLLGGAGAISAAAHIRPDLYVRIFDLVQGGEIGPARSMFKTLLPLIRLIFSEPNPGPVKAALALQGSIREELRLPMTAVSDSLRKNLEAELTRVMAL
jgi:4-hydroxy-tetrahydrodipicolinate synthase